MLLYVYQQSRYIGILQTESGVGMQFSYDLDYLSESDASPISLSLPLQEGTFKGRRCEAFFDGLLPEGDERTEIARYLQVSSRSPMRLLSALGGDCAGAVSLYTERLEARPSNKIGEETVHNEYKPISAGTIKELIKPGSGKRVPFAVDNRLSLAGAQSKLSLHTAGDPSSLEGWLLPLDGSPTTHIIKPASPFFESLPVNEYICLHLAAACGIPTVHSWLLGETKPALVTLRYDRINENGVYRRLSQEDSCQALGIKSSDKYENDGGPGVADIAMLIYQHCESPLKDVGNFLKLLLFNLYIGNCDAHGKNYSLVREMNGAYHLAPAYDLVSTAYYPDLTLKLAMRYGRHNDITKVDASDLDNLATACGVSSRWAKRTAINVFASLIEALGQMEIPPTSQHETSAGIKSFIQHNAEERFRALAL
jgi:serine/threonine-protein kinase HipA